jgi:hypothetical protein
MDMDANLTPKLLPDIAFLSSHLRSHRLVRVDPLPDGCRIESIPWPKQGEGTAGNHIWTGKLSDPKLATLLGTDASRSSLLAALCWTVGKNLDDPSLRRLMARMGKNLGIGGGLANNPFLALAWTVPDHLLPVLTNGILRYGKPRKDGEAWRNNKVGPFRATWADNLSTAFTSMLEGLHTEYIDHPENILPAARAIEERSGPGRLEARGIQFARILVEHEDWAQFKAAGVNHAGVTHTMPLASARLFYSLRQQLAKSLVIGLHHCSRADLPTGLAETIREDAMQTLATMTEKDPSDKETFLAALFHYDGFIPGIERFMGCSAREMAEYPRILLRRIRARIAVSVIPAARDDSSDFDPAL